MINSIVEVKRKPLISKRLMSIGGIAIGVAAGSTLLGFATANPGSYGGNLWGVLIFGTTVGFIGLLIQAAGFIPYALMNTYSIVRWKINIIRK